MIDSGGIGSYIHHLVVGLQKDFSLQLLGCPEKLKIYGCPVVPFSVSIYSLQEQWQFPFKIPRCDLFWSPHFNVPFSPIRARRRVVTIHDVYHLAFLSSFRVMERGYVRYALASAVQKSDAIITVSEFSKREIQRYLPRAEEKIEVIYPGIERERFHTDRKPFDLFQRWNIQTPFFLFVGNFKPNKNLQRSLKAFQQLRKYASFSASFVLVGRERGFRYSEVFAKEYTEAVHFLTDVGDEELPFLYQNALALVFPSLYEGFGRPPLEALCCGCRVIVSDREVFLEVCPGADFFVDPENIEAIEQAMLCVWKEREVRRDLQTPPPFFWEESVRKHRKVLESLL